MSSKLSVEGPSEETKAKLAELEAEWSRFKEYVDAWADNRDTIVRSLREMADELDRVQKSCDIATTVGASVGTASGIAAIASVILFPPAAVGALLFGGAAAASNVVTGVVNINIIKGKWSHAEHLFRHDETLLNRVREQIGKLEKLSCDCDFSADELNAINTAVCGAKGIAGLGVRFLLTKTSGLSRNLLKGLSNAALGVGVALDAINLISTIVNMSNGSKSEAAAKMRESGLSRNLLKGLSNAALGVGVALDAINLISTIVNMSNGSKSEAAAKMRELANAAEHGKKRILDEINRK